MGENDVYEKPSKETVVISVGGSLIVPEEIDIDFLRTFRDIILKEVERGRRFYIIAGGGKTSRKYMDAVRALGDLSPDDLDWIGIHGTRLNAHLLRTIFRSVAYPIVVKNPHDEIEGRDPVVIAAGWHPGNSTDYIATLLAYESGAKHLVNLSDIDYVHTADPKKDPDAKPIERISWSDFRALIPKEWNPGLSAPFDPIAAAEAERDNLEVAVINGKRLGEFEKYLNGEKFIGTVIS